jgi:hypothetical protein
MTILFTSPSQGITVSRQADGSYSWSGQYGGMSLKGAVPIDKGRRCILLIDPDASKSTVFENLLCIDQGGGLIWTAKLPSSPDVFISVSGGADGIRANTWSGFRVSLDENTGIEKRREFTK